MKKIIIPIVFAINDGIVNVNFTNEDSRKIVPLNQYLSVCANLIAKMSAGYVSSVFEVFKDNLFYAVINGKIEKVLVVRNHKGELILYTTVGILDYPDVSVACGRRLWAENGDNLYRTYNDAQHVLKGETEYNIETNATGCPLDPNEMFATTLIGFLAAFGSDAE